MDCVQSLHLNLFSEIKFVLGFILSVLQLSPGSPCKVWCLANNVASTANHNVKDGTRCSHDVDDYSVCVGGVCKVE